MKIAPKRAKNAEIVLVVLLVSLLELFIDDKCLAATPCEISTYVGGTNRKLGFIGHEAPAQITHLYLCRLPDSMHKRGAANPVKYAY